MRHMPQPANTHMMQQLGCWNTFGYRSLRTATHARTSWYSELCMKSRMSSRSVWLLQGELVTIVPWSGRRPRAPLPLLLATLLLAMLCGPKPLLLPAFCAARLLVACSDAPGPPDADADADAGPSGPAAAALRLRWLQRSAWLGADDALGTAACQLACKAWPRECPCGHARHKFASC